MDATKATGPVPPCDSNTCTTCSDEAAPGRVLDLLESGMARVDTGHGIEEVNVELVDAAAGDLVLVHAGVAITKLPGRLPDQ